MAATRVLFRPPEKRWGTPGHVRLNWSRDPLTDLDHIAEGYRLVAHDRVELLRQQRPPMHAGDEFEAYPIVFLYRHALELRLKAIIPVARLPSDTR